MLWVSIIAILGLVAAVAFFVYSRNANRTSAAPIEQHSAELRDLSGMQRDFADTVSIVRQLDLVITVDTSVLHLCGAMGTPVWGLISRRGDWRWLGNDRTDSPWYPSLRLFRQTKLNDWDEVVSRVAAELRKKT